MENIQDIENKKKIPTIWMKNEKKNESFSELKHA